MTLDLPQPHEEYEPGSERVRNSRIKLALEMKVNRDEVFIGTYGGLVPKSNGGIINFLRADGEWADPLAGGVAAHTHPQSDIINLVADLALKAPLASPALTGNPTAPTPAINDNDTSIATTAYVIAQGTTVAPLMDGIAAVGTNPKYAHGDHVHPTDTSLAPKASPTFTGDPTAPTPAPGDNDTSLATTAFVTAALAALAGLSAAGDLKILAHTTIPSGWLACDGAAVSRTTYAALFAIIASTWGAGDGSTTFNVPDFRGRVPVGVGTGVLTEVRAAANFNVSDIITVASNPIGKAKWVTGLPVIITTSGVLPTGIAAATTYYVRRLSATTMSLYATLAQAMETTATTGIVNITATGSGNHTITCTLDAMTIADLFGVPYNGGVPSHKHHIESLDNFTGGSGAVIGLGTGATANDPNIDADLSGDTAGVTNMQPSAVVQYIIKT